MRLHGRVLGLEAGRPVVACDPIAGGAEVTRQAGALGRPLVVPAEARAWLAGRLCRS
ncbi:hypothetical protein [Geodermatophilus sp. SYSU D01119]